MKRKNVRGSFKTYRCVLAAALVLAATPFTSTAENLNTNTKSITFVVPAETSQCNTATSIEMEIVALFNATNTERAKVGLPALTWNEKSVPAAYTRAAEATVLFEHIRPDGTPWYTADKANLYGENMVKGADTAAEAINALMQSESHRKNILQPRFTSMSIGYAVCSDGRIVFMQEFS